MFSWLLPLLVLGHFSKLLSYKISKNGKKTNFDLFGQNSDSTANS